MNASRPAGQERGPIPAGRRIGGLPDQRRPDAAPQAEGGELNRPGFGDCSFP